jgi:hypothetical protein
MKPLTIESNIELSWVREWLSRQITDTTVTCSYRTVDLLRTVGDTQRILAAELDQEGRTRLQKALSARRRREKSTTRFKKVELTEQARSILAAVAESRGLSMSALIEEQFEAEYMKIP